SGLLGSRLGGAGSATESHHSYQEQGKNLFHFSFSSLLVHILDVFSGDPARVPGAASRAKLLKSNQGCFSAKKIWSMPPTWSYPILNRMCNERCLHFYPAPSRCPYHSIYSR